MSGPFGSSQWMYASGGFYPKTINGSLRFNDDDSAFLSRTPSSAGNRRTFTFSAWIKRANIPSGESYLFSAGTDANNFAGIEFIGGEIVFQNYNSGTQVIARTGTDLFRDPAAWYHIVVEVDTTQSTQADRLKLYVNGTQVTSFDGSDSDLSLNYDTQFNTTNQHTLGCREKGSRDSFHDGYMAEVFFIDGTAHDADAFGETKNGIWVPKNITSSNFTMGTNGFHLTFEDDATVEAFNTVLYEGEGAVQQVTGVGFSPDLVWVKTRTDTNNHNLFDTVRGPSRRVFSNLTNAENTTANTFQSFDSDGFTTGVIADVNDANEDHVAWCWDAGDNNAVTGHSSVTYTGSGAVQRISGFGFDPDLVWVKVRNSAGTHILTDSVRGGNKQLFPNLTNAEATSTIKITGFDKDGFVLGADSGAGTGDANYSGNTYVAWGWDAGDSAPATNTNGTITSTVKTNGDFSIISYDQGTNADASIGHGLSGTPDFLIIKNRDLASPTVVFHSGFGASKRLVLHSDAQASASGNIFGSGQTDPDSTKFYVGAVSWVNNTGGDRHIAYAWRNVTGKQQFGKYTGNASSTGPTVTLGFRPGLVMIKGLDRSSGWYVFDTSRMPFNDPTNYTHKYLLWNSSNGEYTTGDDGKIEVTSTGFQIRAGVTGMNASGEEYIYAAWAGSYSDFITDVNTNGSIESRVKASDTTGFSVVSYVGNGSNNSTVGHGLSSVPDWVITKSRTSGTDNWSVWHSGLTSIQYYLSLNNTDMETSGSDRFGTNDPTTSVMNLGYAGSTNSNGADYIMYCWTETAGVSKFGKYTGNASSTGPSVTLGFQPAFVMIKGLDRSSAWYMFDTTRQTTNDATNYTHKYLRADANNTEYTVGDDGKIEVTSTGFQIRSSVTGMNASGEEYIYIAFADTREAAFWLDQSSNNNDFQHVNLDHNDTVSDSPTDSFATLNPLSVPSSPSRTFSDGNLRFDAGANNAKATGTILLPTSGQYYWEVTQLGGTTYATVGVAPSTYDNESTGRIGYRNDGQKIDETNSLSSYGATYQSGDTIGVAFDADADTLEFYKNGVSQGVAFTGMAARSDSGLVPWIQAYTSTPLEINFGQRPFKYDLPE